MDFKLTDEQLSLKKEYDQFFEAEMKNAPPSEGAGMEEQYDSDNHWKFYRYMMTELAKRGWNRLAWPKEYGGREAPVIDQLLFAESMAYHHAPGIDGFGVKMFAPTLMLYASEDQKKRLLPPIADATVHYCQGWSEPNAGSDLASLVTSAIKKGDHYVVNGQKIWTTGAHRADHMFLLARTDPTSKRNAGLSVFNIDMSLPGIEVRPIKYMNGAHIYNEVFFTDVMVPEDDRIGPDGEGWKLTRATMNFERTGAGTFAGLKSTLEGLLGYMKNTKRDGQLLIDNPIHRRKLAELIADVEIGRALAYRIAWMQDKGKLVFSPSLASESKLFGSELRQRAVNFATEIMGMFGQLEYGSDMAPLGGSMIAGYQACMGGNIAAGSSEIQRNIIAWVGVGLPRFK